MSKARKYLVILSSFFIKARSINLILLGTYFGTAHHHHREIKHFLRRNSIYTLDLSIPAASSLLYLLREQNICFSFFFSWSRCITRNPSGVWCSDRSLTCGIARTYECILHLLPRVSERACARVYLRCIPACCTWLEEQSRRGRGDRGGRTRTFYEVRRRDGGGARRRMVGSWDGGEGVRGGEVKSCLLLCGVLEGRRGGARGPKKPDSGKREGARPYRAAAPMMMTTVVVAVMVVVGSRRWKGREKERRRRRGAGEARRESPAQRGPVRRCMADLETRSPQGETRGPKRRPRRIDRNSRESWLFLFRMPTISRARVRVLLRPSLSFLLYLALTPALRVPRSEWSAPFSSRERNLLDFPQSAPDTVPADRSETACVSVKTRVGQS